MANKRVSELNELLASQVDVSDLFLITDVSAFESKKIRASQLRGFTSQATASWAFNSVSSSYALLARSASWAPIQISASYALSASYADFAKTASYVLSSSYSLSSSWASSSFFAVTASYALTASVNLVISSAQADTAKTASYLLYTNGFNNGTASYVITSSYSTLASSSKFLIYDGVTYNGTASAALRAAFSDSASNAATASMMYYDGVTSNGTASVAISASLAQVSKYVRQPMLAGIFPATITSTSESRIATMSLNRSDFTFSQTYITFTGTVVFNYTSSISQSLSLMAFNQGTFDLWPLDSVPIIYSVNGDSPISGTIHQSFTMQSQQNLVNGNYLVYVTASTPTDLYFDIGARTMNFRIDSESDNVTVLP
jgi:hypothetical protein